MRLILVVGLAWGGPLAGILPAAVRPLACLPRLVFEAYDPARLPAARRRAEQLGAPAQVWSCRGTRCRLISKWTTHLEVDDAH